VGTGRQSVHQAFVFCRPIAVVPVLYKRTIRQRHTCPRRCETIVSKSGSRSIRYGSTLTRYGTVPVPTTTTGCIEVSYRYLIECLT